MTTIQSINMLLEHKKTKRKNDNCRIFINALNKCITEHQSVESNIFPQKFNFLKCDDFQTINSNPQIKKILYNPSDLHNSHRKISLELKEDGILNIELHD